MGGASLGEVTNSINSQTNDKSPGNDGLTAEFYKYFLNELSPVLLGVYDSREKFGTIDVSSTTGIISVIYKKDDKKDFANYRPITLLHLDYKIYSTILRNCMQKNVRCNNR